MRSCPRLGAANLALLSIYFAPVWGRDALHVMVSPYNGFEDPSHAAAVARNTTGVKSVVNHLKVVPKKK